MVDGESLLNDGTGLVLFAIAIRAVSEPVTGVQAVVAFVVAIGASVAIGLVVAGSRHGSCRWSTITSSS